MEKKHIWEFTNQKKLTKKEFLNYFERKIFKTIRKYEMLNKSRKITFKKTGDLNTKVLIKVLETKFKVEYGTKPNFSSENSSDIAEITFENILKGRFEGPSPTEKTNKPLYFLSDKEVKLYAELTNTKGKEKKRNPKIKELFSKFISKNQDLEQNVLKALEQLKN